MVFKQWTVLPHDPIDKIADNLWRVEGSMPGGNKRTMSLIRLSDGRLLIHNAIALEDELMAEVTAFGTPAAILVPNGFHRQDAKIMKERFPQAKVYCPGAARKKVSAVVPVDGSYTDVPQDSTVRVRHLDGVKENEGVIEVDSKDGTTLIFCDMILNMKDAKHIFKIFLAPVGRLSVPRFSKWFFVKDKGALRADLERLASGSLKRVIPGHGHPVIEDAPAKLKRAAAEL